MYNTITNNNSNNNNNPNNNDNNNNNLKFNIKCFEHEDNDIVSICDQCSSPVCLICMCSPSHRGHSFNLVEKSKTDTILNEFKKKTYPKSQKFKEQKSKEIQQTEQMYNTVKLNHSSNMMALNEKFKHLHQILSILENDIKRNLDTILSDNEELYIKTSTALENEISIINDILNRHSFNSPSPTPMLSSSPSPALLSSPIDYNLNSVFNQSTKQYLSIIKDNHQLNSIINNNNQFDSFKSTHLEFNNEVIDNIKSSLKSIYNINTKLIIPTIIDNEDTSSGESNEESGDSNEKIAGEDEDEQEDEEKEQVKTNELSTTSTTNLLQSNNKLYQFKIHYREVYNLPIKVEAYLISSHTLSLDENVNILIKVSPKDATVIPKGTKILIANKYFGSVTVEIPINLEMSLFDDDDIITGSDITTTSGGLGGFYTTTTTTTTTTTNTKNTTSTTSSKYTPTTPINTSYFKKIITFNELNRNFNSSFQPTLNIKIQFPSEIGVSYFSYMYPNISWFLGDLKPIKPITIGLEGCSASGKTSTIIGLINLFNQSSTVQQNFTEELGGSSYFQTTKITYRSILKYINSTNSTGSIGSGIGSGIGSKLSSSDSGSSIGFGSSSNSILIGNKSNSSNSIKNGYYVDSTFLKDYDISFLDSWGLISEGDIPLKFKTLGKVHNHLSINERNTIGFGQASKREFSCDVFLFVVSIHNFKCNETMKIIEKRINEAIMLNITPVLAITFTDQVSTTEYASLVSSYTLPIGSNNIFKIINYNGLDIKKDLDKDLLFFKLLYRLVQLCNIKNFN